MKMLFTHRYFWPDSPPYASMLRTIAQHFSSVGHDVHVFASQPSYSNDRQKAARQEVVDGVSIRRIRTFAEHKKRPILRVVNVIIYCWALFWHIVGKRPDIVTASTFPPVIAAWTASLAAKLTGATFVYHMQDIHPEVSLYADRKPKLGLVGLVLRWLDNQNLRRASAILVLSDDMQKTLLSRNISANLPIHVINNFLLQDFSESAAMIPNKIQKQPNIIRIIFAGNLGRFQNLEILCEGITAAICEFPNVELFLLGDGEMKASLIQKYSDNEQVRFGPFLPFAQAALVMQESDIGLVSLTPDIYRVSYPSKLLSYIGLGLPVFALVESNSKLAATLEDHKIGAVPESASPAAIAERLRSMLTGDLAAMRSRVQSYYEGHATVEATLAQWENMVATIQSGAATSHVPGSEIAKSINVNASPIGDNKQT